MLKSFNGDRKIYEAWGDQLKAHAAADQLIQGDGWNGFRGCFIGCSIHEYSHQKFANLFRLPIEIGAIADRIFENLTPEDSKKFAIDIYNAIQVGTDYAKFTHHWHYWLICDPVSGIKKYNGDPSVEAIGLLHLEAITKSVSGDRWAAASEASARAARAASAEAEAWAASARAASAWAASAWAASARAEAARAEAAEARAAEARAAAAAAAEWAASARAEAAEAAEWAAEAWIAMRDKFLDLLKNYPA